MGNEGWNDDDDSDVVPKDGVGVKLWDSRMSALAAAPTVPGMGWRGGNIEKNRRENTGHKDR